MRVRLYLIILLFLASVGILIWIYFAATREPEYPGNSPWTGVRSDLETCGRRKHVQAMQYAHFADIAAQERRFDAERLFRAAALAEQTHERNCRQAAERLGGTYASPTKVVVFHGSTNDNLARSIDYKRSIRTASLAEIGRAMGRGNRYAARVLVWASAGDMRQIMLMERCRGGLSPDPTYCVCPRCGNIYEVGYDDMYCPHCLTNDSLFTYIR